MPYTTLQKLHGSDCPFPQYQTLRAGNLTVEYSEGTLRNISINGNEVIRMIYAAVRDQAWLNVPHKKVSEHISISGNEFVIQLSVEYSKNEIEFLSDIRISGTSQNILTYEMKGFAKTDFLKNRIGICILHPPETCRGKECNITHPDGTTEKSIFPEKITPHQPFKNISGMSWKYDRSNRVTLQFKGDLFETEDQRNWTDASYKTYSTPLDIPFPVLLKKDTEISQSVTIKIEGKADRFDSSEIIQFSSAGSPGLPMPSIGTGVSSASSMTAREAGLLKMTGIRHLRGEIHFFENNWISQYERIRHEADMLELPVILCLVFGEDSRSEFDKFLAIFNENPVAVFAIVLFSRDHKSTPTDILENIVPVVKNYFRGIRVGAGTNCNFAEFNRVTPSSELLDFLSFAIHPQEHASDDRTLVENLTAQGDAIQSALALSGGKKIHVSPVTLKRRFNANVTNYEPLYHGDQMPDQVEPRQMSLFAAAWTVGSLKHVLESGIESVTYFETMGERGLLMGTIGSRWPGSFPAENNMIFPVYHIFRHLKGSYNVVKSVSSKPLIADGFILKSKDHSLLYIANFTHFPQKIDLGRFTEATTLLRMNTENFNPDLSQEFVAERFPVIILKPYETRILKVIS